MNSDNVFTTAAVRDAAIPQPFIGQQCFLVDTGMLIYAGPVCGWRPPWNQEWGEIAYVEINVSVTLIGDSISVIVSPTLVTGLTTTFTAPPNRMHRVEFEGGVTSAGIGDTVDLQLIQLYDGITTVIADQPIFDLVAAQGRRINFDARCTIAPPRGGGALPVKYSLYGSRVANVTTVDGVAGAPARIAVYDLGPTGAPS